MLSVADEAFPASPGPARSRRSLRDADAVQVFSTVRSKRK
ncbi:hypothetical protein LY15_003289 [Prauserella flava]|uniref:Uncharacterized protein n=1 Tax=Prauserella sediminis TaxID=577680 RepID=A0A839XG84_9PSEU|nr:hypothetical protein [Prauserella sediminis]MCR3721302.1 hypothetical protein [Prauserella flava]MCR3734618.1 hypothetical protein [Prauserella salsuginis]